MRGLVQDGNELVAIHRTGLTARSTDGMAWDWVGTCDQVNVMAIANNVPQTPVGVPLGNPENIQLMLAQLHPNPVQTGTALHVAFTLPYAGEVIIDMFDVRGRRVAARSAEEVRAGDASVIWKLPTLPSGVYFLRLVANRRGAVTTRLVVVK